MKTLAGIALLPAALVILAWSAVFQRSQWRTEGAANEAERARLLSR